MQKVVVDFDDFRESDNRLDLLYRIRSKFPGFKATLYTIPMQNSLAFLEEISRIEWLELHPHGWEHFPYESSFWTKDQADRYLRTCYGC